MDLQALQPVIQSVVQSFSRSHPLLDPVELHQEAQIPALLAVRSHDPTRSLLTTWVHRRVTQHLIDHCRSERWKRSMQRAEANRDFDSCCRTAFDLSALLWQISSDAARLVCMVIDRDLRFKKDLKLLLRELQWDREQAERVITEIRQALEI